MGWTTLLLLAVTLSLDAMAVSVSSGIVMGRFRGGDALKMATAFGLFQGLMPAVGYTIAGTFSQQIRAVDHWIAFGLLLFIGGKMVYEAVRKTDEEAAFGNPFALKNLFLLSIATSIDAMAVGVVIAVSPPIELLAPRFGYLLCCGVIAAVTFVLCLIGVGAGCVTGSRLGKKAEILGGMILIALGVKILLEHLLPS